MSKLTLDRDIRVDGHLFEKGSVETEVDGMDFEEILKDIMKNTTVEQAEAVAHPNGKPEASK